jgi:hypothetical protein
MTVREIERTNPFSTALAERGLQAALHKLSLVYGEARARRYPDLGSCRAQLAESRVCLQFLESAPTING